MNGPKESRNAKHSKRLSVIDETKDEHQGEDGNNKSNMQSLIDLN